LALRTHALAYELIQVMLDLLRDEKWGKDAGRAFQTIAGDDDLVNKSNHAVIRLLHKQRFFSFVFPKLVQNARAIEDEGIVYPLKVPYTRYTIELPDRPLSHHCQHPQRTPPPWTRLPPSAPPPIPLPLLTRPTRKRHQHTLHHGHGIPRNHVRKCPGHHLRPTRSNPSFSRQPTANSNCLAPLFSYSPCAFYV